MVEKILIKEEDLEKQQDGSYKIKNNEIIKKINSAYITNDYKIAIKDLISIEPFFLKNSEIKYKINVDYNGEQVIVRILSKKEYSSNFDVNYKFQRNRKNTKIFKITWIGALILAVILTVVFLWQVIQCIIYNLQYSDYYYNGVHYKVHWTLAWWAILCGVLALISTGGFITTLVLYKKDQKKQGDLEINYIEKTYGTLTEESEIKEFNFTLKEAESNIKKIVKENSYPKKVEKYIFDEVKEIKKYS